MAMPFDYDGLRSSPRKNDPEFYPPGYEPKTRPYWRHPVTDELCRYERWQQLMPQTWDRMDLSICPINHPMCQADPGYYNINRSACEHRRRELWENLTEPPDIPEFDDNRENPVQVPAAPALQRPQDALNRSHPQDVAVRKYVREMTKWHRMRYPALQVHADGEEQHPGGSLGWDTSKWRDVNFDQCWSETQDCDEHPEYRNDCKIRTKNIYEKILQDPVKYIKQHPGINKWMEPQAQAIHVAQTEINDWHNPDYNLHLTPEERGYEPICDYPF